MNATQWLDDFCTRLEANEGVERTMYLDSKSIPTVGVGLNLTRSDAPALLALVGACYSDVMAKKPLSLTQVFRLLELTVAPIVGQARASLEPTHFDFMSDARRCAVADFVFNMGADEWYTFHATRGLLDEAIHTQVRLNDPARAHALYGMAADHMAASAYAQQVGPRARRNCEMLRSSGYFDPHAFEA